LPAVQSRSRHHQLATITRVAELALVLADDQQFKEVSLLASPIKNIAGGRHHLASLVAASPADSQHLFSNWSHRRWVEGTWLPKFPQQDLIAVHGRQEGIDESRIERWRQPAESSVYFKNGSRRAGTNSDSIEVCDRLVEFIPDNVSHPGLCQIWVKEPIPDESSDVLIGEKSKIASGSIAGETR